MIESMKAKIWHMLKEKEVSLAMLFNKQGEILWHKGREITGRLVGEGEGFSKSFIEKTLLNGRPVEEDNVGISSINEDFPESAAILHIKSLIIQPVADTYFLYADSGTREAFSASDRETFKTLGELLAEVIQQIHRNETDVGGITGSSDRIQQIRELVLKYSIEEEPVLLLGETGAGKGHIAELIHRYSGRRGKFITINTPSIPENLIESEIFGAKKGAFTDARADKRGMVDEAAGGTLFFDEISEIPASFQAKLLRFIETKKYMVLGDSVEKIADVRIVAATNQNLREAIVNKELREDLYYRLHVLEIEIPPLRERKEDIKELVLEKQRYLKGKQLAEDFWQPFLNYEWPGNIRELITVLIRTGIHAGNPITGQEVKEIIDHSFYKKSLDRTDEKIERVREEIEAGQSFWDTAWPLFINRFINRDELRLFLEQEFLKCDSSLKKLSKSLNITDQEFKKFITIVHRYNVHPGKKNQ